VEAGTAIEIRQARVDDAEMLQRNCKSGATLDQVRQQLSWTTRERAPQILEHFVAVAGDEVVGTVMLLPKGSHAIATAANELTLCRGRNGPIAPVVRLDDWVVTTRLHGHGVGTALGSAVIEEARRWEAVQIESSSRNPRAVRCLEKLGFVEWGQFPHPDGVPEVYVVRTLA
jgi:GNAT superfamily N-acetyltransferase